MRQGMNSDIMNGHLHRNMCINKNICRKCLNMCECLFLFMLTTTHFDHFESEPGPHRVDGHPKMNLDAMRTHHRKENQQKPQRPVPSQVGEHRCKGASSGKSQPKTAAWPHPAQRKRHGLAVEMVAQSAEPSGQIPKRFRTLSQQHRFLNRKFPLSSCFGSLPPTLATT